MLFRSDVEALAASVESSDGVYFVPAFTGLGAPYWSQNTRGTITGLTRGTTAAHLARAALDSIAYQTLDVLIAMKNDSGIDFRELRVDGGATVNNGLLQFQADLLQTNVVRPKITEITALGAAYLAGLAIGYWGSQEELRDQWKVDRTFIPSITAQQANTLLAGWHRAIGAATSHP